ncbi:ring finger protein [Culex quinquefasciatus]|uniref:Ring finger protein n=1 Tax=Culex quinquefasciatus TaxID=7176 RepID=B0X1Z2_CULQU|nr:ring finger protein [Culex quinquefasciatus]|eukprot:XP_001863664.1 ring finger protein [Culex quinquefasciatus]
MDLSLHELLRMYQDAVAYNTEIPLSQNRLNRKHKSGNDLTTLAENTGSSAISSQNPTTPAAINNLANVANNLGPAVNNFLEIPDHASNAGPGKRTRRGAGQFLHLVLLSQLN